jgi:hypothetical protein
MTALNKEINEFINQLQNEDVNVNDIMLICDSFIHNGFVEDIMIMLNMCFPPRGSVPFNFVIEEDKDKTGTSEERKFRWIHSKFYENNKSKYEEGFITEQIFIAVSELHNQQVALEMVTKYCVPLIFL